MTERPEGVREEVGRREAGAVAERCGVVLCEAVAV
jgi:hypothetical protein